MNESRHSSIERWNYKLGAALAMLAVAGGAEAQINVASQANGGVASQSSNWDPSFSTADKANDANRDGIYANGSVAHTGFELNAWWQVQLSQTFELDELIVWNRVDVAPERINPFRLTIFDGANIAWEVTNQTFVDNVEDGLGNTMGMRFVLPEPIAGDRVRLMLEGSNWLQFAELEAYSAVPEPATLSCVALGSLLLLRRRRR